MTTSIEIDPATHTAVGAPAGAPVGALSDDLYLGPAVVTAVGPGMLTVAFAGQSHAAQPAFALAYRPVVGDVLLVMARSRAGRGVYAVGVLDGRGTTEIAVSGDLALTSHYGRISISAGEGVAIATPQVTVRTQVMEVVATSLVQRVQSALLAVADLLHLTAGRRLEKITGSSMEQAQTRHLLSEKETIINASTVHIA